MINAEQIRAARALLDWSTAELAKQAGLTVNGINKIERGHVQAHRDTMERLEEVFEHAGIEFLDFNGVRFKPREIQTYRGVEGFKKFMDNVHDYVRESIEKNKDYEPVCSSSINDKDYIRHLGDYFTFHIDRMNALKGFRHRILLKERPASLQPAELRVGSYREYRKRSPQDTANVPFYVYGDRLAILMLTGASPEIIVISSTVVAQAYREIFNALWQMAEPFE